MKQSKSLTAIAAVLVLSSFANASEPVSPVVKFVARVKQTEHLKQAELAKANNLKRKTESFKVNASESKLTWLAKKVAGEHSGTINVSTGSLNVENNVLKGGSFDLDTKTITVTDITDKEGNAKLLGHLKSEDFFAVDKFGAAKFVITSATNKGAGLYNIKGNLTIKGITNEVSFPATVAIDKTKLTASAKIIVDRTKYDIKYRSKSFFENLGDKTIYDDFELNIQLIANK